jgi:hypothetical protein
MNTLTRLALLAPVLLGSLPLAALADAPADYSHVINLALSGKNALVQVRLPPAVYLHAQSEQLDDLRVFDAAGKALPFALLQPEPVARVSTRELPAAIFPVHADRTAVNRDDVEIRTSTGGTITAITTRSGTAQQDVLSALVLDFGHEAASQAIDALVFTLPPALGNYEAQVTLEVSDDLRNWDTLGHASLSWLSNSEQQTLTSNRMEFPARTFRYGRLVWREGKPLRFATISAQAPVAQAVSAPLDSVTLQPKPGRFANDLVYEAGPAIPAERIGLSFGPGNVVMPALLGHYAPLPATHGNTGLRWDFVPRLQATFYQFVQNGAQRHSGDIAAAGIHASQWVLRPQAPPPSSPTMTLSWRPATLVFMASGSAPYSLQVGHAQARSTQRAISEVAPGLSEAELGTLEQAAPGEAHAQNRQAMANVAQAAETASFRRKLVLWGVLLLGVAVLSAMAWKLTRQMKNAS